MVEYGGKLTEWWNMLENWLNGGKLTEWWNMVENWLNGRTWWKIDWMVEYLLNGWITWMLSFKFDLGCGVCCILIITVRRNHFAWCWLLLFLNLHAIYYVNFVECWLYKIHINFIKWIQSGSLIMNPLNMNNSLLWTNSMVPT